MSCCRDWHIFYFETKNQLCQYWHSRAPNQSGATRKIGGTGSQGLDFSTKVQFPKMVEYWIHCQECAYHVSCWCGGVGLASFEEFMQINDFSVLIPIKYMENWDFDWSRNGELAIWLVNCGFERIWLAEFTFYQLFHYILNV